jgi:hypothetical protein
LGFRNGLCERRVEGESVPFGQEYVIFRQEVIFGASKNLSLNVLTAPSTVFVQWVERYNTDRGGQVGSAVSAQTVFSRLGET